MSGPLFVTSTQVNRHGVFAIARTPPAVIKASGSEVVGYVAQFPWGPMQSRYEPSTIGEALKTLAPAGMDRTGSGYLGLIRKGFPIAPHIVGVRGVGALKATRTLSDVVPTVIATLTAKYEGAPGNSMTATVSAASDGDAQHWDLEVKVTGASGTTTEKVKNINFSGVGADSTFDFSQSVLIGAITKNSAGRPLNGTSTFTGGTSPAVVSGDYVGTAGTGDKGVALFEGDGSIREVCCDDPGNTIRAAVNAGLVAHAIALGDRVAYINGNSGLSAAATRADKASYVSQNVQYLDPWIRIRDDIDGTLRLVPPGIWGASLAAQTSPSTPTAWKALEQREKLGGIVSIEFDRGDSAGLNTESGVSTFIAEDAGGFSLEASVVTGANVEPAKRNLTRTRMGIYIAKAIVESIRAMVDAPNVEVNQDSVVMAIDGFLGGLKRAKKSDPNHTPFINDYKLQPVAASNTTASLQAGDFTVEGDIQIGSAMERIFFSMNYGETVTVSVK